MTTNEQARNSFIPKEIGSLPRILLLDFNEEDVVYLRDLGYQVIEGYSGFSDRPLIIPKHESEIEIIFWDTSNIRKDNQVTTTPTGDGFAINTTFGQQAYVNSIKVLKKYFDRVAEKNGFIGILLDDIISIPLQKLPDLLDSEFEFKLRRTSTLYLNNHQDDDVWFDFYERFVRKENVKFAINWNDNLVGFINYFEDEDNNVHAVTYRHFAIIPKIEDKRSAITYLLQDVLPHHCKGDNIFPDKFYYRWTNSEKYLPPAVQKLKSEIATIVKDKNVQIENCRASIKEEIEKSEYLSNMLIADDSDLFTDENKLSSSIQKVLEKDLGFKVTDVDKMRLQVGESLKEDKWIEDKDFFALVEIKGTERGAKANWIRQDLTAHIREFEIVKDVTGINSVLIFNHERREAPENRNAPFAGDTDLMTFSKKSNICLLPVYELFKLVRDIKEGVLTKDEAREKIKSCKGMFSYNKKV